MPCCFYKSDFNMIEYDCFFMCKELGFLCKFLDEMKL